MMLSWRVLLQFDEIIHVKVRCIFVTTVYYIRVILTLFFLTQIHIEPNVNPCQFWNELLESNR